MDNRDLYKLMVETETLTVSEDAVKKLNIARLLDNKEGRIRLKNLISDKQELTDAEKVKKLRAAAYEVLVHYKDPNHSRRPTHDVMADLEQALRET